MNNNLFQELSGNGLGSRGFNTLNIPTPQAQESTSADVVKSLLSGLVPSATKSVATGLIPTGSTSITETATETPTSDTVMLDDDTVEYTYKQGDTFGQVIKDLGFMTDNGLWGNNGDVKYYEKQLRDQGWEGGNIPIGTRIRLRRRPAVQYDIYGNRVK